MRAVPVSLELVQTAFVAVGCGLLVPLSSFPWNGVCTVETKNTVTEDNDGPEL